MPLDPLILDDLDWRQLTDAARQRIPALSAGRWTLHAPVDPGITLVELFAWLLDQRVYAIDRVPEPLFRAMVELLGARMQPVGVARSVMALERSGPRTEIAAGATLDIARADAGPIFAAHEGIQLLDAARVELFTRRAGTWVDHTHDLREQRSVALLGADGGAGEARIVLWLRALPAAATRSCALFLDLDTPSKVLPEWHPEATEVPPPAQLTWWYSRGPAVPPQPFPAGAVRDGTRGLRRAGIVRFAMPNDWGPDGNAIGGLTPYALFLRTHSATFSFPPSVRRIVADAAVAEHRRIVRERLRLTDWLPLPGQSITLDASSAPPIPNAVRVHVREIDGQWHRWRPVVDFARSGPTDRVFRVDRERRRICFGDGLNGRIPRPDATVPASSSNAHIAVAVGGGTDGNVGAGLPWVGERTTDADVRATTLASAVGGAEAESIDQARVRIAGLLDRVDRAVTVADHVTLAQATPGVAIARAHAAVGFHPAFPCMAVPGAITVFVVPWAPRGDDVDPSERVAAPMPDPGALAAARAQLDRARIVGTQVFVCPPRYRTVRLAVRILADPVDPSIVRMRVDQALRRFLDPLIGGDDREGWPFGDPLRPSALMREATAAIDAGGVDQVAIGLDGAPPTESCEEVAIGPNDLPALTDVVVTFAAEPRGSSGGLR